MIVILGGGISGLSAAYQLKKAGKEFILLEQKDSLGGVIKGINKNDYVLESGPNTVLINNAETKELIEGLGLWDELIFPDEVAVKSRFVLKNGNLEAIPTSFKAAIKSKLFKWSTLRSILKEPFIKANKSGQDESLADFARRRLGKQIYEDFITPFVTGIYAGDPEKMSINYTLDILKEAEDKHGSILKGMPKLMKEKKKANTEFNLPKQKIFSFKKGLNHLISTLSSSLGNSVQLNSSVNKINKSGSNYKISYTQGGEQKTIEATHVISCLPAFALAEVTKQLSPNLSSQLNKINYVPAVIVHLAFSKQAVSFKQHAFGILSRNGEAVPFLGILFNSRFFPHTAPKDKDLITVICGGSRYPELIQKSDTAILEEVQHSVKELLHIKEEAEMVNLLRWNKGIPQYEMSYASIEKEIDSFLGEEANFYIAANFYKGISVSDCIKNGSILAKSLIN